MTDIERFPLDAPPPPLGPLVAALAKAQTQFATVTRDKTVTVQTRTGGSYQFKYAPLDTILAAVKGPLSENGLVLVQTLDEGALVTSLLHESGASISGRMALPGSTDIQGLGSAITYLRRYAIQAVLGIAAEEDDDGNRAAGNQAESRPTKPEDERPELLGNLAKSGKVSKGTAEGYKLEWREGPDGHTIGFRIDIDGDDRSVPQVLVKGVIGEGLWLATGGDPKQLLGQRVSFKGKLYGIHQAPPRKTYFRLVIGEHPDAEYIETPDVRIPALSAPEPTTATEAPEEPEEAPSVELFKLDPEERAMVAGDLG